MDQETLQKAYTKQIWGEYDLAVWLYDQVLERSGPSAAILNNRIMCSIALGDYDSALQDSEKMVKLFPAYKKSFYRKGEVLYHMKRLQEAEKAFQQALTLEPACRGTYAFMYKCQQEYLLSLEEFSKHEIFQALRLTNDSKDALDLLRHGIDSGIHPLDDFVYVSDEEPEQEYSPFMDPNNPLKCSSLWIGYVTEQMTEKDLRDLFSKNGGPIKSIAVLYERQCAFVNYYNSESAGRAMRLIQNYHICGKNLLIKYAEHSIPKKTGKKLRRTRL